MKKKFTIFVLFCLFLCGCSNTTPIDVDLTIMGPDMVYATVYQMMTDPQTFLNKKVCIQGTYDFIYYEDTDTYYTTVLIADAMGCCQQGLEFIWEDGSHPVSDYPEIGQEIKLTGIFETYTETEGTTIYLFCRLKDAKMTIL